MLNYKYNKKVRIKNYSIRPSRWNREGKMDKYMGQIVTMMSPEVRIKEDIERWQWQEEDFEEIDIFEKIKDELFKL